jgi:hypothetical protein
VRPAYPGRSTHPEAHVLGARITWAQPRLQLPDFGWVARVSAFEWFGFVQLRVYHVQPTEINFNYGLLAPILPNFAALGVQPRILHESGFKKVIFGELF